MGYRVAAMAELTLKQAAAMAGIPERTLRRWAISGRLAATRHGHAYRVTPDALAAIASASVTLGQDGPANTATVAATTAASGLVAESMAELLRMLDQRDRTIMELSGRLGYMHAELAQAKEQLALQAPQPEPMPTEPAPIVEAVSVPATRRWWRRWLG